MLNRHNILFFFYFPSKRCTTFGSWWKICDVILRERCKQKSSCFFPSFFQSFPMPYLTSLKVPAFSHYSTCWDQGYRCLMEGKKSGRGVWGAISPLWPRYHPIWFKTSTLKESCLSNYCWEKKKTSSQASATLVRNSAHLITHLLTDRGKV